MERPNLHPHRKFFRLAPVALLCVSLAACTPKFIVKINGYPAPEEVNISWSPDRSISAQWFFIRWHLQKIESQGFSEYVEAPEYLSFDAVNVLPPDTQAVVVNLGIDNPQRKKYRVAKVVTLGKETKEEFVGDWTIREYRNLVVTGPVRPNQEVSLAVKLLSEDYSPDQPLLSTGELRYRIQGTAVANTGGAGKGLNLPSQEARKLKPPSTGKIAPTSRKDQKILTELAAKANGQKGTKLAALTEKGQATLREQEPRKSETPKKPTSLPKVRTEETQRARQTSAANFAAPLEAKEPRIFLAHPTGVAYHLPGCRWIKNVPLSKLRQFSSQEDAIKAGYQPCIRCCPGGVSGCKIPRGRKEVVQRSEKSTRQRRR